MFAILGVAQQFVDKLLLFFAGSQHVMIELQVHAVIQNVQACLMHPFRSEAEVDEIAVFAVIC